MLATLVDIEMWTAGRIFYHDEADFLTNQVVHDFIFILRILFLSFFVGLSWTPWFSSIDEEE